LTNKKRHATMTYTIKKYIRLTLIQSGGGMCPMKPDNLYERYKVSIHTKY